MRIVSKNQSEVLFEHKSWEVSVLATGLAFFFGYGVVVASPDLMLHEVLLSALFPITIALAALALMETSRVVIDRDTGTVRLFRKRAFRTIRLVMPLDRFVGVISERTVFYRTWWMRPALIFRDGEEVWLIPACRGSDVSKVATIVAQINDWHGVATLDVKRTARAVYKPAATGIALLAEILREAF